MYPPNLFLDIYGNPTALNTALKWMNLTKESFISSDKFDSFQNLSIVNFDCENVHKNKSQLKFFKCTIDDYEQDSVSVFDVFKQQHYRTLIITNNEKNFNWGVLSVLSLAEGSFIFYLHINEHNRS